MNQNSKLEPNKALSNDINCPLTGLPMIKPVYIYTKGATTSWREHAFELYAIVKWVRKYKQKSQNPIDHSSIEVISAFDEDEIYFIPKTEPAKDIQLRSYQTITKMFIDQFNIDLNKKYQDYILPLMISIKLAFMENNFASVKALIRQGAKLDTVDYCGKTPFTLLTEYYFENPEKNAKTILGILKLAKPFQNTNNIMLCEAIRQKHYDIIQCLIEKEINVNHLNDIGESPFETAVSCKDITTLKILLKAKNINTIHSFYPQY